MLRDFSMHANTQQVNRLDDNEAIYFGTELTHIKKQTYDKKYPRLMARAVIPISYDAGPGAETIKWYQMDIVGVAKIINNYAKDFPRASIKGKENISNIKGLGASFGYNVQEIRAAMMAGRPLPEREAAAARRSILKLENDIAFFGNDANQLGGLLTNPNVTISAVANDGNGASTLWTQKSPDQIIRDVNVMIRQIPTSTKDVEYPNTVLMPVDQYELIARTPRSNLSNTTILQFLKQNHEDIEFGKLPFELAGTGPGSTDQMIAYTRDPEHLTLEIPQEYEQFEPTLEGMEYEIPVHERCGGVIIYYPLAMNIAFGI